MDECVNCGHAEEDHKWVEALQETQCGGDGFFENSDPLCDCDLFEAEEEEEE